MQRSSTAKRSKTQRKKLIFVIAMLSVALIHFLLFWLYINYKSILLAFQTPASNELTLINFQNLFAEFRLPDSVIPQALKNTMIFFSVSLFIITPVSLFFSYFIYKKIAGYKIFRIIFFFPSIISVVILTSLYSSLVSVDGFIAEWLQKLFGLETIPNLLGESRYALVTIIIYCIWTGMGVNIVLFNGAMARIPEEIIEYDQLEGVGYMRELVQIVVPLIWPTLSTVIILAVVGMFNASGPVFFFTMGNFNTYTISYWIFEQVYIKEIYEYASAVGLFFTMIGVPIVIVVKKLLDKVDSGATY